MKKYFFSLTAMFFCSALFSQTIKVENGFSFSRMVTNKIDILDNNIINYSVVAGCDYWDHKLFYLSSEIGYITKGGKESDISTPDGIIDIQDTWQYIHLNTTMRFKYQIDQSHFYIGIGPKLDALIGSNKFTDIIYSDGYEMNRFSIGCIAELGVAQDLNRFRVGVNYSYLVNFGAVGKSPYFNVYNNTHTIRLSLGYRLK
jgi:hypothetical protein